MRPRVWLRAAALAAVLVGVVVGLTLYFSTESVPPCFVSGVANWRPPTLEGRHRFAVVFPDRAACFVAIDDKQRVAAQFRLDGVKDIASANPNGSDIAVRGAGGTYTLDLQDGHVRGGGLAPYDSDFVTVTDPEQHVMFVTQRGLLGFRVIDLVTGATRYVVHFKGFTWNPRFGPNPPSHGLALAPDRPELWVLDAPNHSLHVFDVSQVPSKPPRRITDVRLETTMTTSGSLTQTADGHYLYVGGSGDVIDTRTRQSVEHLDALEHARAVLQVNWAGGRPEFPGLPR